MTTMRSLSASGLIEVWERGAGQLCVERAITMLSACTEESADALWELSIGDRDARLLVLYAGLFGPTLEAFAECPRCGERLEYGVPAKDLAERRPALAERLLTLQAGDTTLDL